MDTLLGAVLPTLIAVGLWFYVAITENGTADLTISGVPVVFLNEDLLEENSPAALAGVTIPTLRQTTKRTAANFRHLNCFIGFASHSFF